MDDDEASLIAFAARLTGMGYEVRTARDGFEALAAMRDGVPDLLISGLQMPNMSGFELLSIVRRRFPATAVIAHSTQFATIGNPFPLCDKFIEKGLNSTFELLEAARELLSQSPLRSQPAKVDVAPAWLPRAINGYIVLTCLDCLPSFSVMTRDAVIGEDATARCAHCDVKVRYHIDDSALSVKDELAKLLRHSQEQLTASRETIRFSKELLAIQKSKVRRKKS